MATIEGRKSVAQSRPRRQIPKRHRGHQNAGSPRRLNRSRHPISCIAPRGRRQVQPGWRRHDRLQRLLHRGRGRLLHQQQLLPVVRLQHQRGPGWTADGIFTNGSQIELTKVWSALAGYEHIWNPKWRTSWFGGYVNVDYSGGATNFILQKTPGALAACGVPGVGATTFGVTLRPGNSCSPDFSFWEAGTRTQWNPVPQLDVGLEVLYSRRNTAFKGAAMVPANSRVPRSSPSMTKTHRLARVRPNDFQPPPAPMPVIFGLAIPAQVRVEALLDVPGRRGRSAQERNFGLRCLELRQWHREVPPPRPAPAPRRSSSRANADTARPHFVQRAAGVAASNARPPFPGGRPDLGR